VFKPVASRIPSSARLISGTDVAPPAASAGAEARGLDAPGQAPWDPSAARVRPAPRALGVEGLAQRTHQSDSGLITRLEAGGTQRFAEPLDPQMSAAGSHYAVLSVAPEGGAVQFGLVARGAQLDERFIPVNGLGVALAVKPAKNIDLQLSADSVFPDGDLGKIGEDVRVMGSVKSKF
jgi:hypothetical protein